MMEGALRDIHRAVRTLRGQPGFVAGVVATFAIAIGTNAAMFGLITRLMLSAPPGISDPERVVRLAVEASERRGESYRMSTFAYPMFEAMKGARQVFAAVAASRPDTVMVGRNEALRPVAALGVSGDYFTVLRATPLLGRLIGPDDDALPLGASVAVIGHGYWARELGRDPAVVGRSLTVDGSPFVIIGVARPGFNGDGLATVDLFLPLAATMRGSAFGWWTASGMNLVQITARLSDGVSTRGAADIATTLVRAEAATGPSGGRRVAELVSLVPGSAARNSTQSRIALWLTGVAIVVLLIATANVGTLLLLRAARRRRETAVRVALGTPRGVLGRQLVIETVLLSFAGGAIGLLLARWLSEAIRATLLPSMAPSEGIVDARVLAASIGAAVIAGSLAALSPILQIGRLDLAAALRAGGEQGASARLGGQQIMVGVQVGLCTVLLIGAGLFVRSLERVQSQDLGFTTEGILFVTLDFQGYATGREKDAIYESALRRIRTVDGVQRATLVEAFPFGPFHVPPLSVPGHTEMPTLGGQPPFMYPATTEYLAMMGVSLRQGRLFNERDQRSGPLVVLVNESMARTIWPGESAIGKCVRAGYAPELLAVMSPMEAVAHAPCREVVGIVKDTRARSLRGEGNEARQMQYYVPFEQVPAPPSPQFAIANGMFVQTDDPSRVGDRVRLSIQRGLERSAHVRVRRYQDLIDPQLRTWRLGASLFSLFGALALGIAAVGLFGVISYLIGQRTREIGVRVALGASRRRVWSLVIVDALKLVAGGMGLGTIAAMAAGPLVRDMLFRTSPWEPANAAAAIAVLLGVTVVAAVVPAWRAGRVDPLAALRADG